MRAGHGYGDKTSLLQTATTTLGLMNPKLDEIFERRVFPVAEYIDMPLDDTLSDIQYILNMFLAHHAAFPSQRTDLFSLKPWRTQIQSHFVLLC